MNKLWMAAVAVAAMPVIAIASQAPAPTNAAGTWSVAGAVAGVDVRELCTFTQGTDLKLTGTCDVMGEKWPTTGTVADKKVTWTHKGKYNGDDYVIVYTGTLDEKGELHGGMDVDPFGVSGEFNAVKQ